MSLGIVHPNKDVFLRNQNENKVPPKFALHLKNLQSPLSRQNVALRIL